MASAKHNPHRPFAKRMLAVGLTAASMITLLVFFLDDWYRGTLATMLGVSAWRRASAASS